MRLFYNPEVDPDCNGNGSNSADPPSRLNASTGSAGPLPIITTLLAAPIPVVNVSISTEGMAEPVVLLHFSSIISLPIGVLVNMNFEISRSFNGGAPVVIGSNYVFATLVNILEAEAFGFQYFDNNLAPGLYNYTIQLSTNSLIDITPGVTVTNATLSALAVDNDYE